VTSSKRRAAIEAARISSEGDDTSNPPQPSQGEGVSEMSKRKLEHYQKTHLT